MVIIVNRKGVRTFGCGRADIHTLMVTLCVHCGVKVDFGMEASSSASSCSASEMKIDSRHSGSRVTDGVQSLTDSSRFPVIVKSRHRSIEGRRGERRGRIRSWFSTWSSTSKGSGVDRRTQSSACALEQATERNSSSKEMSCQTRGDKSTTSLQNLETLAKVRGAKASFEAQWTKVSMRSSRGRVSIGGGSDEGNLTCVVVKVTSSLSVVTGIETSFGSELNQDVSTTE